MILRAGEHDKVEVVWSQFFSLRQVVSERDSVCILQTEEAKEDRALEDSVLTACRWTAVENAVIGTVG
jgi:hypothetical protein